MKITFIKLFKSNHKPKHSKIEYTKNKILSKNQMALLAIALMLISASYMNQTNHIRSGDLGDAKLVSTEIVKENTINENKEETENNQEINEIIETSNTKKVEDYFVKTRLDRETMYSQMIETYTKILKDEDIPTEQKSIASNEIKMINERKNEISIIENIIKTKDFKDVVILINDNSVNAIIKQEEELSEEQVAIVLNIVSRELNIDVDNIHISIKNS